MALLKQAAWAALLLVAGASIAYVLVAALGRGRAPAPHPATSPATTGTAPAPAPLAPAARVIHPLALPDGASWTRCRGDQGLAGVVAGEGGQPPAELPDDLELAWSFKTGGPVKSSPVIADGRVFFGSDDGHVYCVAAADAKLLWSYQCDDAVQAPPLYHDGVLYVGADDGCLYAFDARGGELKWRYPTGDKIVGSANWVVGGDGLRILACSYDRQLHCLSATGRTVWTHDTGNPINGAPAVAPGQSAADTRVVFGGCDGKVHQVSLSDGETVRDVETGSYVPASPAVSGGRAYVGNYGNEVLCVDLSDGEIVWRFTQAKEAFFSSPAVTDDRVVVGCRDKNLYCLSSKDGRLIWSFPTRGQVDGSPVIRGQKVVFGGDDGRLYIVSLAGGEELWSCDLGEPVRGSPAVAGGCVIVGCDDGSVYAFGPPAKGAKP